MEILKFLLAYLHQKNIQLLLIKKIHIYMHMNFNALCKMEGEKTMSTTIFLFSFLHLNTQPYQHISEDVMESQVLSGGTKNEAIWGEQQRR